MFKKLEAFPDGKIKYHYGDKVITETREGITTISYKGYDGNTNRVPAFLYLGGVDSVHNVIPPSS